MGAIPPRPRELNVNGMVRNEAHVIRGITGKIVNCRIYDRTVLRSIASLAVITKSPERHCEVRSLQAFCHNFVKLLKYRAETLISHTNALELIDYHFRTRSPAQRRSREYLCTPLDRCASGTNIDRYMPRSRFQWPLAC